MRQSRSCTLSIPILALLALLGLPAPADAQVPCIVPDNGTGTATLPPAGCEYVGDGGDTYVITNGLPAGTTLELVPTHGSFVCNGSGPCTLVIPAAQCEAPGGTLGGDGSCSDHSLELQVTGTGALAGYARTLFLPMFWEVHSAPRTPGSPVQAFATEVILLDGQLFGDPDFDTLRIRAGSSFGLPSPGQTTLTDLGDGTFNVDSFFDVAYQIDFVGAPGSPLDGFSGTTPGNLRIRTGVPGPGCVVPDNGTGTVTLPPAGCSYVGDGGGVYEIVNGLPPGATIELAPIHGGFVCNGSGTCTVSIPPAQCEAAGGTLGGDGNCSDHTLEVQLTGTGALAGFARTLSLPMFWEVHSAPRIPGSPVQSFATGVILLDGQLPFGDPDFDTLRLRAGSSFGLPSPGQTTLIDLGDGTFNVDSFFDVAYQIEFVGAPGGQLDGLSGTTPGTLRIRTGISLPTCTIPDNGTGTGTLPPAGCAYVGDHGGVYEIVNGLPAGSTIELAPTHGGFVCNGSGVCTVSIPAAQCEAAGGTLGGDGNCSDHMLGLQLTGTGALAGFARTLSLPMFWEVHSAPRIPGSPVQSFQTAVILLDGQLFGDPDFASLRLRAGSSFQLPSPGQTTLTDLGNGTFNVDSFFDIAYEIDFQGAPGGQLDGLGGTTPGTLRIVTGRPVATPLPVPALPGRGAWLALGLLVAAGLALLGARAGRTTVRRP